MNTDIQRNAAAALSSFDQAGLDGAIVDDPKAFHEKLADYARLEHLKRELDTALKTVKKRQSLLGSPLLQEMARAGIQNINIDGFTLYGQKKLNVWKKPDSEGATKQAVCDCLKELGWSDIVHDDYSPGTVKSYIKEMLDNEEEIPQRLKDLFQIEQTVELTARIAS